MRILEEKLPSKLERIPGFISEFLKKLKSLPIEENELFDIRLCVEEALVNAMKHGNQMNPELSVAVNVEADKQGLVVRIEDEGKGFDYKKLPDPTHDENAAKTHGRGVFLIKNLMDKVEFFEGGRCIKMQKSFKKGGRK